VFTGIGGTNGTGDWYMSGFESGRNGEAYPWANPAFMNGENPAMPPGPPPPVNAGERNGIIIEKKDHGFANGFISIEWSSPQRSLLAAPDGIGTL
jgi:hypothetical protein